MRLILEDVVLVGQEQVLPNCSIGNFVVAVGSRGREEDLTWISGNNLSIYVSE